MLARSNRTRPDQLMAKADRLQASGDSAGALKIYQKILKNQPRHAEILSRAGIAAIQSGRAKRGIAYLEQVLAQYPTDATALHNLGAGYFQSGDYTNASKIYARLVEASPGDAAAQLFLGTSLRQLGHLEQARAPMERALELQPTDIGAINNLGGLLLELGDPAAALALCQKGLERAPDAEDLQQNCAGALAASGRHDEAIHILKRLAQGASGALEPQLALARGMADAGRRGEALTVLRGTLERHPAADAAWTMLSKTLAATDPSDLDQEALSDASRCMARSPELAARMSRLLCAAFLDNDAAVRCLRELGADVTADLNADAVQPVLDLLRQPPFIAMLNGPFLIDPGMERLLTAVRRWVLLSSVSGDATGDGLVDLTLLCPLACQCFENEYVFMESPEETRALEALKALLGAEATLGMTPEYARRLALLGCYRGLHTVAVAEAVSQEDAVAMGQAFEALFRLQLEAPRREAVLRSSIRALTPIADQTSKIVGAQYEANPYPRWQRLDSVAARPLGELMLSRYPMLSELKPVWSNSPQVLVAGCGTGRQAIRAAQLYQGSRILAMDLSLASLGYAQRQAQAHRVANIEFARGDILEAGRISRRFDVVSCTGVLHHLADPEGGWRLLLERLRPGGFMQVALYSRLARLSVSAAREFARDHGWNGGVEDIRHFRQALLALPESHPARAVSRFRDFYALSECRDLVFHPQEDLFDIPRIGRFIDQEGLRFVGFEFADWAHLGAFKRAHPEQGSETSLALWDAFENTHPDTFAGMYVFWVMKP